MSYLKILCPVYHRYEEYFISFSFCKKNLKIFSDDWQFPVSLPTTFIPSTVPLMQAEATFSRYFGLKAILWTFFLSVLRFWKTLLQNSYIVSCSQSYPLDDSSLTLEPCNSWISHAEYPPSVGPFLQLVKIIIQLLFNCIASAQSFLALYYLYF